MGIECSMWQINPEDLKRLLASEDDLEEFCDSHFPETYDENFEDDGLWLGKIWHLLHYIITGDPENEDYPLAYAIMVGHPIEGLGGVFCWLAPEEVKDVARALNTVSKEDLKKRSSKESMSKVNLYRSPSGHSKKEFEEIMTEFNKLKRYYEEAARKGNAMLRLIN